ncbi:helix-turn-helix transcriptional regulator [Stackebrandtia nassauensis]|uniref:Transcriptional regulator, AraC family n=1 Tax=Stackebrandtia nassauensis (strain DSM 44728 / CIP 108903 / NRRL B-16338 / NBRC 102104 / LLR-40K-21) TaxID=446470 RepID=D3Q3T2_STANL|nr:AraC family transcriptional regulator [Stackebrandtia nassauensis]ADD43999.1 transcriptional regulator, AraC family [Stackebrandtia nassauensis DSM 44728]
MLTTTLLARHRDFAVHAVHCRDDHRGWAAETVRDDHRIVLVRRGGFRRRADGASGYVDVTCGYVGLPGQEERFAHPVNGDVCTSIHLDRALWAGIVGDTAAPTSVRVDAPLDLAHRGLLRAAEVRDVDFAVAEQLVHLAALAVRRAVGGGVGGRDASGAVGRRDAGLVAQAREAIAAGHPQAAGLTTLAQLLRVSPYRLSRAFSAHTGMSVTRYRNRLRTGRAVDAIEAGETRLGELALRLGFADQAHLTRTVKQHYGHPPVALRELLRRAGNA